MDKKLAYDMGVAFSLGKRHSQKANDAEGEGEPVGFFTSNGAAIPIFEGQSKKEAAKSFIKKKDKEAKKTKKSSPQEQAPEAKAKMEKHAARLGKGKYANYKRVGSSKEIPKEVLDKAASTPPATAFGVHYSSSPDDKQMIVFYDAKGREHAIYSKEHVATQSDAKYAHIRELDKRYPQVKAQIDADSKSSDPKVRSYGLLSRLVAETGTRIGSERDTGADEKAYGASTLLGKHIVKEGGKVYLRYIGKEAVSHDHEIKGELGTLLLKRSKEVGAEGKMFNISDSQARDYMKRQYGAKPKDFRTRIAGETFWNYLKDKPVPKSTKERDKVLNSAYKVTSDVLGNKPKMAKGSYVDPALVTRWMAGAKDAARDSAEGWKPLSGKELSNFVRELDSQPPRPYEELVREDAEDGYFADDGGLLDEQEEREISEEG